MTDDDARQMLNGKRDLNSAHHLTAADWETLRRMVDVVFKENYWRTYNAKMEAIRNAGLTA